MRLYSGLSTQFIRDSAHNQIAEKLKAAFFDYFRYQPPRSEVESWRNSLRAVSQVFETASLHDHGVLLEYQLPMTSKRLDCLRSGTPQIEELLRASKVAVFLIDDRQLVRPDEIGSAGYIIDRAKACGCQVFEYQLEAQFRCAGSDAFVSWIDNTLEIARTPHVLWEGDEAFEFVIVGSPEELDQRIRMRLSEGSSARLTAGYCWRWSAPRTDGTLVDDIQIGAFQRPWNAKPDAKRLAPGIPKAPLWAHEPGGVEQVGCIYTAQGFEFDYVGVIVGPDLRFDFDKQAWVGDPTSSFDSPVKRSKERFVDLVKNTYRVLLSRGLKGCYVHFMDRDTERFVRSRLGARPAGT